jgi:teichuronic acid biosynthesis glycosyltransferase TuaC
MKALVPTRREPTLRVLHVTGAYPDASNPHPGAFIASQVDSLRRRGLDVDVCVLHGKGLLKYVRGVREVRRCTSERNFDLVHAHYMYAGWSARLGSRLPLVVSFMGNDVFGQCDDEGHISFSSRAIHWTLSNALAFVSAHAVVKSKELGDRILSGRKSIIPNGVDLELFRPQEISRAELGLADDTFYVLFAGKKSEARKRYRLAEIAVENFKLRVPRAELICVEGRTQAEIGRLMNAADCLILTSTYEGSPNVVKEALACNLPVVSVDVGDVRERLEGIDGCHVVRDDPEAIAEAFARVHARGGRLSEGRSAMAALSLERIAERISAIYSNVLRDTRRFAVLDRRPG